MATTKTRRWTADELERTPPDGRWELIAGELVAMTPAGGEHGEIGSGMVARLWLHNRGCRLGKVYGADTGFVLAPNVILVPDAAFVRMDRLPAEEDQRRWLRLAPDLVVEVVSPTDRAADVAAKVARYLDAGVTLLWVLHPRTRAVTLHAADRSEQTLREGDELDGGEVLPGFRVAVAEIFG